VPASANIRAGGVYVEIVARAQAALQQVTKFGASLDSIAAKAQAAGLSLAAMGDAVGGPLAFAARSAADFSKGMADVGVLLGSRDEARQYEGQLRDLSVMFGQTADAATKAFYDINSAGRTGAEGIDFFRVSNKLAISGVTNAAAAGELLTTVMNAYGLATERAGRVGDILIATQIKGKTTVDALSRSIGNVAGQAAISGISFEDLSAAISEITAGAGGNVEGTARAMVSMAAILTALNKPAKQTIENAKKLHVNLSPDKFRAEGLVSLLEQIKRLSSQELASIFPRQEAVRGLATLITNIEKYKTTLDYIKGSSGLMDKSTLIILDEAATKIKQVTSAFEQFGIVALQKTLPQIGAFADTLRGGLTLLGAFVEKHTEYVRVAAYVAAGAAALGAVLIGLGLGFKVAAIATQGLMIAFSLLKGMATILLKPLALLGSLPVAILLAVGAMFLFIDSLQEVSDWTDTSGKKMSVGLSAWVGSIRVAGHSIRTWLAAAFSYLDVAWFKFTLDLERGVDYMKKNFLSFGDYIAKIFHVLFSGIYNAYLDVITRIAEIGVAVHVVEQGTVDKLYGDKRKALTMESDYDMDRRLAFESLQEDMDKRELDRQKKIADYTFAAAQGRQRLFEADEGKAGVMESTITPLLKDLAGGADDFIKKIGSDEAFQKVNDWIRDTFGITLPPYPFEKPDEGAVGAGAARGNGAGIQGAAAVIGTFSGSYAAARLGAEQNTTLTELQKQTSLLQAIADNTSEFGMSEAEYGD